MHLTWGYSKPQYLKEFPLLTFKADVAEVVDLNYGWYRSQVPKDLYGNYQDNYYTRDYQNLINTLQAEVELTCSVNLGSDGVVISNVFKGDFTKYNCAIVEHEVDGTHLYKIVKKQFIKRNLWRITMDKKI